MISGEDRHKGARFRTYKSRSAKRRQADVKLAKIRRVKEILTGGPFFKGQIKQTKDNEQVIKIPSVDEAYVVLHKWNTRI